MRRVLAAIVFLAMFTEARASVIHVRTNGSDANSGLDWAHAKATVGAAIQAASAGDEIWVAAGVYAERIRNRQSGGLSIDVALYGGFAGTEIARDQRDFAANASILDGEGLGEVVIIDSFAGPGMRVDGFRIRNGASALGGGIHITAAAPTIANNDILGNGADFGGGVLIWGYRTIPPVAHAVIDSNVLQVNRAGSGGGAIAVVGASPEIVRNVFLRNTTGGEGGGIGVWVADSAKVARPRIANNFLYENAANRTTPGLAAGGGAIYATEHDFSGQPVAFGIAAPRIEDNVIAANASIGCGAGIAIVSAETESAPVTNNTIVYNSGSGICWGSAGPTIVNNLVAYNTWGLEQDPGTSLPATIRNNDVWGNTLHGEGTDYFQLADRTGLDGNLSADPLLVAYGARRQRIQPGSPCRDAGDDSAVGAGRTDIDQESRIDGAHVDIGADESDGTTWPDWPAIVRVEPTGDDANDGSTWALAKATIQSAIDAAWMRGGGEVWVEQGTYEEHPTLAAFVTVYGGFAGNEATRDARDPSTRTTTIDGTGQPPVVNCGLSGYRAGGIDGFTITGGGTYSGGTTIPPQSSPAAWGGGIRCTVSSPVIRGNAIVRNSLGDPATTPFDPGEGGGIGLVGSHALVHDNVISENEALNPSSVGGGVYAEWSAPDLWNNTITRNRALQGAAVHAVSSRPMLFNNWIAENEHYNLPPVYRGSRMGAVSLSLCWDLDIDFNYFVSNVGAVGGAIWLSQPYRGTVANNLFVSNHAFDRETGTGGEGGAIWLEVRADPQETLGIVNNTFYANGATNWIWGEMGGAIAVLPHSSDVMIANNVMAFNSSGIYRRMGFATSPQLDCNLLFNDNGQNYVGLPAGASDVVADPLFVDRAAGNYRLESGSPAIDAGAWQHVAFEFDLDGAPRPQDGNGDGIDAYDMGAYEFSPDADSDGTPDWLDADDDDDGVVDDEDCAPFDPAVWEPPVEVGTLTLSGQVSTILTWTAQAHATAYDIAGGSLLALRADHGFARAECMLDDATAPTWTDTEPDPPSGDGRYYLVRAQNAQCDGGWGGERVVPACP